MFRRKRRAEDFRAEIDAHLELEIARFREQGLSEEQAQAAARRTFGNRTVAEERFYERGRWLWLDTLRQDVRLGWRLLVKTPGWTAVALLTAALGIGASVAMFSVIYAVVLRPLPYPGGERIHVIRTGARSDAPVERPPYSFAGTSVTFDTYNLLHENTRAFDHVAAWGPSTLAWVTDDGPRAVSAGWVTSEFFATFGVHPLHGRAFLPEEDGTQGTAILAHGFWRRAFGGDASVVGRSIPLNVRGGPRPVTVVGIMPPELDFPRIAGAAADLWVPWPLQPRGRAVTYVVARASPAATPGLIASDVDRLSELANAASGPQARRSYAAEPLRDQIGTGARGPLYVFAGATALILLIVCFNLANLLLARASSRQREIAVRGALGAPRRRIVQQLLTESMLIAIAGGCAGVGLAWLAVGAFNGTRQAVALGVSGAALDGWVIVFAIVLTLGTGIVFGLAPLWSLLGAASDNVVQRDAHRATASAGPRRTLRWLVVGQLGFSLTLLIGAGLLGKSYYQVWSTDPGFDPGSLVVVSGTQAAVGAPDWPRLTESLGAIPGVAAVALGSAAPGTAEIGGMSFTIDGQGDARHQSQWTAVSAGYFDTLGVPLERGRLFTPEEASQSPSPIVVNEGFARQFFAGDALGRRLTIPGMSVPGFPPSDPVDLVIVGVVGDFRQHELELAPASMIYRLLHAGNALPVIRARSDAQALIPAIRQVMTSFQPDRPPAEIATVAQLFADSLGPRRFQAALVGAFALVAMTLAIVGVYGVMAYLVTLRTREVGIRLALGARPVSVRMMILREGAALGALGAVAGLAGAAALTRYLTSLLLDVSAYDPAAFGLLPFVLLGAVVAACYVTARRAAGTDVLTVLRHE